MISDFMAIPWVHATLLIGGAMGAGLYLNHLGTYLMRRRQVKKMNLNVLKRGLQEYPPKQRSLIDKLLLRNYDYLLFTDELERRGIAPKPTNPPYHI